VENVSACILQGRRHSGPPRPSATPPQEEGKTASELIEPSPAPTVFRVIEWEYDLMANAAANVAKADRGGHLHVCILPCGSPLRLPVRQTPRKILEPEQLSIEYLALP